jgi:hypothetical protein
MSLLGWPYGRLVIPDEMRDTWLKEYAKELMRGAHSLYFAERKTPVFRMHFDLDFKQAAAVRLPELTALALAATTVFRDFYPGVAADAPAWRIMVLTAPPKPTRTDGVELVKSGCHLIWPELHVDQGIALQLRLNFVAHLTRTWPARVAGSNSYDDVVDETVLTNACRHSKFGVGAMEGGRRIIDLRPWVVHGLKLVKISSAKGGDDSAIHKNDVQHGFKIMSPIIVSLSLLFFSPFS